MKGIGSAILLLSALAGPLAASHIYSYRFPPGEDLTYTLKVQSRAQIVLPDGTIRNSTLASKTTYVQSGVGAPQADGTIQVASRILSTSGELDGKAAPESKTRSEPRTFRIKPSGAIAGTPSTGGGAGEAGGPDTKAAPLPVVFPEKPLEFQDSFERVGSVTGAETGLALKTTYTLSQVGATLLGYDRPVAVFSAKVEVASPGTNKDGTPRKLTLRKGEGMVWFDEQAGRLVRSKLTWVYDEEVSRPDGKPRRRTVAMATELALGAP